jgi:thiol:disulfide interchange protein
MKYLLVIMLLVTFGCSSRKKIIDKEDNISNIEDIEKVEENKYAINFIKAELLSDVLTRAEKEDKWIYLDLGAKWCLPCKLMKQEVYSNKETVQIINENFIPYMVDVEKGEGPDLKLIFEIKSYPTLLFIDSKGKVKLRKESSLSGTGLISFAKEAIVMKGGKI